MPLSEKFQRQYAEFAYNETISNHNREKGSESIEKCEIRKCWVKQARCHILPSN